MIKKLLFFIIPVAILIIINRDHKTEFWKGKYDPEYCYLLNGLNLADKCGNVGLYEHPGTTAIIFSAIVIKTTHFIRQTKNDLATDVLLYPEIYLKAIAWTFTLINCIIILLSGMMVYKLTKEITFGLLFQSVSLFSTSISYGFYQVSPEPLLFGASILLVLLFLKRFYFNQSFRLFHIRFSQKHVYDLDFSDLIFGILIGFCIATKINSIALLVLPLLFIPKFRDKVVFLTISLLSFLIFTIPIAKYYAAFLVWIKELFFHSGYYGRGNEEIINWDAFTANFLTFIRNEPILFFTMLISLFLIFILISRKKYDRYSVILSSLFLVQLFTLIMVLKHFRLHYFIPVIPTIALSLFVILRMVDLSKIQRDLFNVSFILVCFLMNVEHSKNKTTIQNPIYDSSCVNIYAYGSISPLYALALGDSRALNANAALLEKLYGKQFFYHIWKKELLDWKQSISIETILKLNKPVFLYADENLIKEFAPDFKLKLESEGKYKIIGKLSQSQ
jgi:hypothetical protein